MILDGPLRGRLVDDLRNERGPTLIRLGKENFSDLSALTLASRPKQAWQTTALSSGDILHMPEIGIEIPAGEFYDGIEFAERTWTIIGVTDVALSFKWYQTLLDLPESEPAHDYFGQILDPDGTVILCLHKWGDHEHPSLISSADSRPGHGLLLFFVVDNFDIALQRARASGGQLLEEPHLNPNSQGGQSLQKV